MKTKTKIEKDQQHVKGHQKKVYLELDHLERCGFLPVAIGTFEVFFQKLKNFDYFWYISWEFLEQKNLFFKMDQN